MFVNADLVKKSCCINHVVMILSLSVSHHNHNIRNTDPGTLSVRIYFSLLIN